MGNLLNFSACSFLICKMGIIILTELFDMRDNRGNILKSRDQDGEHKRLSVQGSDCY